MTHVCTDRELGNLPDLLILCMTSSLLDLQHFVDVKLKLAHKTVDSNEAEKVFVAAFEWLLVPVVEQCHRYAASVEFTCIHLVHVVKHIRMHLELQCSSNNVTELRSVTSIL